MSESYVLVQGTGFVPYFLYTWDGIEAEWLPREDLARRFTRKKALRIASKLNAARPGAPIPVWVRKVA